jgi:hypothetical protein
MTHPSTQTVPTTVRITPEQHSELKKHPISSSVIIRVLLNLWIEGKITIDEAIAEEKQRTDAVVAANQSKFKKEYAA